MLRFYVRLSLMFMALFTLLAVTMSALGSIQPIHPALRGFVEGCEGIPQPCWYGIVPGVTTMLDATSFLEDAGYIFITDYTSYARNLVFEKVYSDGECTTELMYYPSTLPTVEDIVRGLYLRNCHSIYLSDVLEILGSPSSLIVDEIGRGGWTLANRRIFVEFSNKMQPYSSIDTIWIDPPPGSGIPQFEWHGFVPFWRYCQVEPDNAWCR